MDSLSLLTLLAVAVVVAYYLGSRRPQALAASDSGLGKFNSLPFYYGIYTSLWCALPSLLLFLGWQLFDDVLIHKLIISQLPEAYNQLTASEAGLLLNNIQNIAAGNFVAENPTAELLVAAQQLNNLQSISASCLALAVFCSLITGTVIGWLKIAPQLKARTKVESAFKFFLLACSCIAILTTVGIVLSVLFESLRFFQAVPLTDFLFGTHWSPQMAIREDQVGGSGAFGAIPLFTGTLLISFLAMLVAVPAGLMAAIYLSEYASPLFRQWVKPLLEILAGIPTVVYGFFAALTVAPMIRDGSNWLGLNASSESALAAGLVMGIMIIPFVSSLSDDVISAVPQSLRDGSLGLGATDSETIKQVVIPAALPGIVGGVLLAASRAIGETMIVVMAAGLAAHLTANPLESVTTVTVQIVTLLVGDQEFDSPKTLAAFALGLMLFIVTLGLNFIAQHVVKKYREQYD